MISSTYRAKMVDFEGWLRDRNRSQDTISLYSGHIARALAAPDGDFLGPLRDRARAPKTRRSILAAMRAWARYTKDDVLAARLSDIRETLPVPRKVNPKKPLSADERERFLRSLDRREKDPYVVALLGLLATRGLRVSDVLRLTRKEVNYGVKEGVLPVETKGGVRQEFYLAEDAVAYLRVFQDVTRAHDGAPEWKTVLDLVAPAANHKTDRRRAALTIVGRACKRVALAAKVKATPHILRHTVARLFLDTVSQDMAQLVAYMGWLRPETAFNYISFVDPAKLRDAAEKMKRRS